MGDVDRLEAVLENMRKEYWLAGKDERETLGWGANYLRRNRDSVIAGLLDDVPLCIVEETMIAGFWIRFDENAQAKIPLDGRDRALRILGGQPTGNLRYKVSGKIICEWWFPAGMDQ